MKIPSRL